MKELQDELIDAYAYERSIAASSFEFMGKLLDIEYVKTRLKLLGTSEIFVYGGGYLGIQFYNAAYKFVDILAVIDKKGKVQIDTLNIPVMDINRLKETYKGQSIIVASVRFYREIRNELLEFVPDTQIVPLGEFLGGILK